MKVKSRKSNSNALSRHKQSSYRYDLLSDLMNYVPDVIYFKDLKGRLITVNQAHAKGLGVKPEDVIGKTDFDIHPKKRAKIMAKDDMYVIKTGKPIIDKIERATRADGVDNYVSTTKIPRLDKNGKIIGLIGITRDITRRKQLDTVKHKKQKMEKKLESLEELNKLKSEFISVVSHELRTPIAIIKEAVNLIADEIPGKINEKQKSLLLKADNNITRLRHLIDELLDISRIESGRFKLRYSLVNLNNLIKDSADYFTKTAEDKEITLKYHISKKHINIFVDAERITQVITNLITNAIKYTEHSGRIDIEVKLIENKVRVGIFDTGIGIDKKSLLEIFNKFVQVSKIDGSKRKGAGLGLSIAKELVEKHEGVIWAESTPGIGSRFYFTLPRFYSSSILDKNARGKINILLQSEAPVYLINLLIINYKEFKKRVNVDHKKLFNNLRMNICEILSKFKSSDGEKPELILTDKTIGEFGIILPDKNENDAVRFCRLIKNKITRYFKNNSIKDVFVNIGIMSYPQKGRLQTTLHLLANLNLKRIYIGPETRRFRRIAYKAEIQIILPKNKIESTQTIDISLGGACIETKIQLETDAELKINLKLPLRKVPLYLNGRAVWIKAEEIQQKDSEGKYKVGIEFTNINNQSRKALAGFINSLI